VLCPVVWIDDHPGATAPRLHRRTLRRVLLDELTGNDLVIVTPDQRERIVERLHVRGIDRVVTADGYAAPAAAQP
jgi:hypothetical protein